LKEQAGNRKEKINLKKARCFLLSKTGKINNCGKDLKFLPAV